MRRNLKLIKLILLGCLAMFLLNFPLLSIVGNRPMQGEVAPVYIYVFVVWLILLVLVFLTLRERPLKKRKKHE